MFCAKNRGGESFFFDPKRKLIDQARPAAQGGSIYLALLASAAALVTGGFCLLLLLASAGDEVAPEPVEAAPEVVNSAPLEEALQAEGEPLALFDFDSFDLGVISAEDSATVEFVLRNVGLAPIEFKVEPECGCTILESFDRVVPPGEFVRLVASIDLKGRSGEVRTGLKVTTNERENNFHRLSIAGTVIGSSVAASPKSMDFGKVALGTERRRRVAVEGLERGLDAIADARIVSWEEYKSASKPPAGSPPSRTASALFTVEGANFAQGQVVFDVVAHPRFDAPQERVKAAIRLDLKDDVEETLFIPIAVDAIDDIKLSTSRVMFARRDVDGPYRASLVVRSLLERPLTIASVASPQLDDLEASWEREGDGSNAIGVRLETRNSAHALLGGAAIAIEFVDGRSVELRAHAMP
jgi:hypothetical protein